MALFPTQPTLTQGSLHYRLATLGYQKRNTYGVETFNPYHELRNLAPKIMTDCAEKPSVLCQYSNECMHHGECYNNATPSVLCQYSNEYMRYGECYNDATPSVLCRYSNECMCHGECYNHATRYELCF